MTLPRLCLIADGVVTGRAGRDADDVARRVLDAVAAGVPWVALRDPAADGRAFLRVAGRLAERLRALRPDVTLSVHGRLDVARRIGAIHHATRHGAPVADGVTAGLVAGASVHDAEEASRAVADGASYVFASPVWPTKTHPGAPVLGLDGLRALVGATPVPVLALGGVDATRVAEALAAGVHGVAVLSAILDAWDVPRATPDLLSALDLPSR